MSGNVGGKPSFLPNYMQKEMIEEPTVEPLKKEDFKREKSLRNSITDKIDKDLPYTAYKPLNNSADTLPSKKQPQHSSSGALRASSASSGTLPLGTEETKKFSSSKNNDSLKNAINAYKLARSNFLENEPVAFPVYISPHSPATYGSIEFQEAAFALTAIHDAASEGSYHFGTKIAQILDLTQRKLLDGRLYRSSELPPEIKQAWIAQINESRQKILFLQDCRLFLNEIKAKWGGQKYILPEQKIALEHLSLAILSKVRLGTSVALPLDFVSPYPEDNHATILGIEPHTANNLSSSSPAAIISMYETNGDMSRRIVPHDQWLKRSKESGTNFLSRKEFPKFKGKIPSSAFVSPKSKIYSKTQLALEISLAPDQDPSSTDARLPDIVEDLTHWISMGSPPKNRPVTEQIKELRKELRLGQGLSTPTQELQAIQKYGSCELKSMYSYLKHTLPPVTYEIIRREIIAEARNMLIGKQETEKKAPAEKIWNEAVALAAKIKDSDFSSNEIFPDDSPKIDNVNVEMRILNGARDKLLRADRRMQNLIDNIIPNNS